MNYAVEPSEAAGMSARRLERIRPAMQSYIDRGVYAGISTLIARRGKVVHAGEFGWRDKEAASPMTADTIFRLYSMTKPIICTALMTLLEEGRFRLIEPLAKYIPAFGPVKVLEADGSLVAPVRPILIRDLMTHMSGLSYHFVEEAGVGKMYTEAKLLAAHHTLEAVIDDLARFPLAFQPGSRWRYSVGIDVAARVIEVISGRPLGDFLRERLFEPLGMTDTAFGVPSEKRDRVAAMYGRPDVITPGPTMGSEFAAWMAGANDRIDVSKSYPVDSPDVFVRGAMASSAPSAIISASPRCWPMAERWTASASLDARRSSLCTRITCRRRSCRSRLAACRCPAMASVSAHGCCWMCRNPVRRGRRASSAGQGRRRHTIGSIRRSRWSASS
jgi:CubicO group peptidase (beta-lactamase class C family)